MSKVSGAGSGKPAKSQRRGKPNAGDDPTACFGERLKSGPTRFAA